MTHWPMWVRICISIALGILALWFCFEKWRYESRKFKRLREELIQGGVFKSAVREWIIRRGHGEPLPLTFDFASLAPTQPRCQASCGLSSLPCNNPVHTPGTRCWRHRNP